MADYALVVGIDSYWSPGASLRGAVKDAVDFATWLVERAGVAPARLMLSLGRVDGISPAVPAALAPALRAGNADYASIIQLLGRFRTMVTEGEAAGRIYFYFAGHGVTAFPSGEHRDAVCPSNFSPDVPSMSLTTDSIEGHFRTIPAAEQYFLYDCCRNLPVKPDIRLGVYDQPAIGQLPYPPQFTLKATAVGGQAVEADEGGTFTQTLLGGLRDGEGAAKQWDDEAGQYVVRWRRLCQHVADRVTAALPGDSPLRAPQEGGEHRAGLDPELCRFDADAIPKTRLTVALQGDPPFPGSRFEALRIGSFDPPVGDTLEAGRKGIELTQAAYVVRSVASGFTGDPVKSLVELYAPTDLQFRLQAVAPMETAAAAAAPPAIDFTESAPAGRAALHDEQAFDLDEHSFRMGFRRNRPANGLEMAAVAEVEIEAAPPPAAADDVPRMQVFSRDPMTRIEIETMGGTAVATASGEIAFHTETVGYRITATGADGLPASRLIVTDDSGEQSERIEPPAEIGAGVRRASDRLGWPIDAQGVINVPDLAPIAAPDLATLAALALARWHGGDGTAAAALGWGGSDEPNDLLVVNIDESGGRIPAMMLWGQQKTNRGSRFGEPARGVVEGMALGSLAAAPGAYWLESEDPNRQRRAGFKLGVAVLDGHRTVVIVHRRADGTTGIYQMLLAPDAAPDAIRRAMFLQRRRQSELLSVDDAATSALIAGQWFEPVSAAIAGWLALRIDVEAGPAVSAGLAAQLAGRAPGLVDGVALAARCAELDGRTEEALAQLRTVLARAVSPVLDEALDYVADAAHRLRVFSPQTRWLDEKTQQSVGHRLWMMRREDDLRRTPIPVAMRPGE